MARIHVVTNAQTGEVTSRLFTPDEDAAATEQEMKDSANYSKQVAANRIKAIKDSLVEHLLTLQVGTPAEKALATAAANQLRAELALEKAKL